MIVRPYTREEIETMRSSQSMSVETSAQALFRWLASVDARDAEIARLRAVLREAAEALRAVAHAAANAVAALEE